MNKCTFIIFFLETYSAKEELSNRKILYSTVMRNWWEKMPLSVFY